MRSSFAIAALALLLLAGCGSEKRAAPGPTATATVTPAPTRAEDPDLAGYSQGVKDYYVEIHNEPTGDAETDVEIEYHQPPRPAEAGLGETITLTGTNIGIRQKVTVTKVDRAGDYTAVHLKLENTGITVYEAPLRNATVTYADGDPVGGRGGREREVLQRHERDTWRNDVGRTKTGCLLFPAHGELPPERFQLALEIVPANAGGIWNLGLSPRRRLIDSISTGSSGKSVRGSVMIAPILSATSWPEVTLPSSA